MGSRRTHRNNQDKAVALRYRGDSGRAPTVIAKGRGLVAQQIREVALQHGIPIREDNDLVNLLSEIDIDREIPPELYSAIAEILAWVYRANESLRKDLL